MSLPLGEVAALLRQRVGIDIKSTQFASLQAAIARTAPGVDGARLLEILSGRVDEPAVIDRLIDEVTVHETYFLRAPRELAGIDWQRLAANRRRRGESVVRVWSAACSTGEEAYTLALLACETLGTVDGAPPVSILGTDVSHAVLARAREGRYGANSVRHLDAERRRRWLSRVGDQLVVDDALRRVVRFEHHNLGRDVMPPLAERLFDLIVCRNVFMYLEPHAVRHALDGLERSLDSDGQIVFGAVDRLCGTAQDAIRPASPTAAVRVDVPQWPPGASHRASRSRSAERRRGARAPGPTAHGRQARRAGPVASVPEALRDEGAPSPSERVRLLLAEVSGWDLRQTVERMAELLEADPLDADAYYVRGVAELALGERNDAVASLRRALYLRPQFALAAFKLGRAYDTTDDARSARRAYAQALDMLDPDDELTRAYLDQIDLGDVAEACRARLNALAVSG